MFLKQENNIVLIIKLFHFQTTGDDEEEAYSPSSSFTPPPATESIPFFDSKSLPDIKLPSNLQEILASIKGQNTDTNSNNGAKPDPIVQAYGNNQYTEDDDYSRSSSTSLADAKSDVSQEKQPRRDPRQSRIREMDKQQHKTSLSQLSDADLIRKAAEMERPVRPVVSATIPPPVSLAPTMTTAIPPPNIPPSMPPTLPPPQVPKVMPPAPLPPLPTPDPNYFPYPPPLPPPPYPQQVYPKPPPPIMTPHPLPPPPKKRKDDYEDRREGPPPHRRKWEHRDMGHNINRGRHHRGGGGGQGGHRPGFRSGNFDPSSARMFRGGRGGNPGSGGYNRIRGGNMYRGSDSDYVPPHRVVSEWDEEIRNFEQRKAREFNNRSEESRDFSDRDNFEQRKSSRDFNRDENRDFGDRDRRDRKRRASRSPSRHKSGRHRMRRASSGSS